MQFHCNFILQRLYVTHTIFVIICSIVRMSIIYFKITYTYSLTADAYKFCCNLNCKGFGNCCLHKLYFIHTAWNTIILHAACSIVCISVNYFQITYTHGCTVVTFKHKRCMKQNYVFIKCTNISHIKMNLNCMNSIEVCSCFLCFRFKINYLFIAFLICRFMKCT